MGGEKLYRFYAIIFVALLAGAGFGGGNLHTLSAQELDAADTPEAVPAVEPGPESLIVFDAAEDGAEIVAPGTFSGFSMLRMVLVLALSAAAIYGVVFFFRRLAKPSSATNPHLRVLARAAIASGNTVAVVSLGTRAWLVGAGDGGVSLIAEIEDQELVDTMLLDNSRNDSGGSKFPDFSALLRRLGGGKNGKRLEADDLRRRRERLNRL